MTQKRLAGGVIRHQSNNELIAKVLETKRKLATKAEEFHNAILL